METNNPIFSTITNADVRYMVKLFKELDSDVSVMLDGNLDSDSLETMKGIQKMVHTIGNLVKRETFYVEDDEHEPDPTESVFNVSYDKA